MRTADWYFDQIEPRAWEWAYRDPRSNEVRRSSVRFSTLLDCLHDAHEHGYDTEHKVTIPRRPGASR